MTTRPTLRDERIVDQLLLETDMDYASELKPALLGLRSLAAGPVPVPSAKLAALMAAPAPIDLDARRKRKRRRVAIATLAVAASMGIGTAAVAATDPGFREKAGETITTLINTVTHGHSGRPAPAPKIGPTGAPGQDPDHPTPARGAPGRSGQEGPPSSAPGEDNSGQETRPSFNPGTPPVTTPAGGLGNAPTGKERQNTGNNPSSASPPTIPHN